MNTKFDPFIFVAGSFVLYKDNVYEIQYLNGQLGAYLDEDNQDVFIKELKPVEITLDILKKIGFKYSDFFGYYFLEPGFRNAVMYNFNEKILIIETRNGNLMLRHCNYIHQIQSALKLFNLEFIIVKEHLI